MPGISFAVMTHNEIPQFHWMMEALAPAFAIIDEIVVIDDFSSPVCVDAIRSYEDKTPLRFYQRALNKNFAKQRNYMKAMCRGDLIFFLDPDEIPTRAVAMGLPAILNMMQTLDIDACTLPRRNVVYEASLPLHPSKIDLKGPDVLEDFLEDQVRILRNLPHLHWTRRLHEYVAGIRRGYHFPHELEFTLLHPKTKAKTTSGNLFYKSIRMRHLSRLKNSIYKRLPWRHPIEWVNASVPF